MLFLKNTTQIKRAKNMNYTNYGRVGIYHSFAHLYFIS